MGLETRSGGQVENDQLHSSLMHHLLSPRGRDESEPCLKSSNPIRNQFADEESGLVFGTSVRTKTLKQEVWMLLWCLRQGFMCFLIAGGSIVTGKSFTPTHVCNVCYLWAKPFSTQLMKIFQIRQRFVLGSPEPTPTVGFFQVGTLWSMWLQLLKGCCWLTFQQSGGQLLYPWRPRGVL